MRKFVVLAALLALLLVATSANAAFQLKLEVPTAIAQDVYVDSDGDGAINVVNFAYHGWTVNVTTAVSYPAIGTLADPQLYMSVSLFSIGDAPEIIISASIDGLGPLASSLDADHLWLSGSTAGTASVTGWLDPNNELFGEGWQKPELAVTGGTEEASVELPDSILNDQDGFSMTLIFTVDHDGTGVSSFNATNEMAPEPATLAIWSLLGVAGIVFSRRRRAA